MTNPDLLQTPYTHEDQRILAYMSWYKKLLAFHAASNPSGDLPFVSIIVPVYNRASILRRALLSILSQTMPRLEVVVVDDGSEDDVRPVVDGLRDDRVRLVRLGRNSGAAHARNVGLDESKGQYVAYLDSDDWWDSEFLAIMVDRALRTGHEFLYSAQRVLRPALYPGPRRREVIRFAPYNAGLLENANYISQISVLHSKQLSEEVGGFDESFRRYVDWEFFLRLCELEPPLAVPAVLSHYNQADQPSISTTEPKLDPLRRIWTASLQRPIDLMALAGVPTRPYQAIAADKSRDERSPIPLTLELQKPWEGYTLAAGRPSTGKLTEPRVERRVTIVIPSYGVPEYLQAALASIVRYTRQEDYDLVVVDNGSDNEVQRVLNHFEYAGFASVKRNDTNLGFTQAVRQGMELSDKSTDVVVLNNDALVTPLWLEELSSVAHRYGDAGMVAPRQVLLPGDPTMKVHVPGAIPEFECDTNLSAHHDNVIDPLFDPAFAISELAYAPFFCVLLLRETLEECGYLDRKMGAHYQSDWVYCDAVRNVAKRRILHTPHAKVYHFNGRATKTLRSNDAEMFAAMASDGRSISAVQRQRTDAAG